MKALQNNFTTHEQSKRLLELGIPIDSADMHIAHSSRDSYSAPKFNDIRVSAYRSYFPTLDILPCWSVGRLIEIMQICSIPVTTWYIKSDSNQPVLEFLINDLETSVVERKMDFSKLEK